MGLRNLGSFGPIIKQAWGYSSFCVKFGCFLHVTTKYLILPVTTYGPSMLPAIELTPSLFLTETISARSGQVTRGDIVCLCSPANPTTFITKRVVGMEGDTVTYLPSPMDSDQLETIVVPKGHVWVEGDNIFNSKDSRNFGPVPYGLIQGRIFWRVLPLKDFGPFLRR